MPQVVTKEIVKQVPRVEVQVVEKQVAKPVYENVERIVEVPPIDYEQRIVEAPEIKIREVVKQLHSEDVPRPDIGDGKTLEAASKDAANVIIPSAEICNSEDAPFPGLYIQKTAHRTKHSKLVP